MITRKIKCDFKGCGKVFIESSWGTGFSGWGNVAGIQNGAGEIQMDLCPEHLKLLIAKINEAEGTK